MQGADQYLLNVVTKGVYLDKNTPISECQKELQFETAGEYEIWVQAENAAGKSAESNHIIVTVVDGSEGTNPDKKYTLSYDLNGGTGEIPAPTSYAVGAEVTISTVIPTRQGYEFVGWSFIAAIYSPGFVIFMPENDMVLVAMWKEGRRIDGDDVFIEQAVKGNRGGTCTLASATMMLRRRAILDGLSDWETITENSVKKMPGGMG